MNMPRKKINARARGNAYQRDVAAWLQARGWIVRNFPVTIQPLRRGRVTIYRSIKQDVFGADIVARRGPALIWIQVQRTKGGIKDRLKEFSLYFGGGLGIDEYLFIFSKIRGGWKIKIVNYIPSLKLLASSDYGEIRGGQLFIKNNLYTGLPDLILFEKQIDEIEKSGEPKALKGSEK